MTLHPTHCWLLYSLDSICLCSLQFTDHGIEGVVPLELLPPDVRSKYQAKPNERSKRAKKEESKSITVQAEENQVHCAVLLIVQLVMLNYLYSYTPF